MGVGDEGRLRVWVWVWVEAAPGPPWYARSVLQVPGDGWLLHTRPDTRPEEYSQINHLAMLHALAYGPTNLTQPNVTYHNLNSISPFDTFFLPGRSFTISIYFLLSFNAELT